MTDGQPGERLPLIAEHDTWISVDPIVGCPANCKYCYLGPLGLRTRKAEIRVEPHALIGAVRKYLHTRGHGDRYDRLAHTPVCFGNYTDTFMSEIGITYFKEYARLHAASLGRHPLCVVTKARLSGDDLAALDEIGQRIVLFLSQSFLGRLGNLRIELGPTSKPEDTTRNLELFASLRNVVPVHFLRPVTRRNVPNVERAVEILAQMRGAGAAATVAVGLKLGPGVALSAPDMEAITGDGSLVDR